jgi:hypothetical protein
MDRNAVRRVAVMGAVMVGIAAGSYGIASAASGSGSSSASSSAPASGTTQSQSTPHRWGGQRSDETLLTGEAKSKVEAAALARVSGGTVVRVETDADGNAAYEAHMTRSDGTPVTVYVNRDFEVVSVEGR